MTQLRWNCQVHWLYLEKIFNITKIDRWFLTQIKEIVDFKKHSAIKN